MEQAVTQHDNPATRGKVYIVLSIYRYILMKLQPYSSLYLLKGTDGRLKGEAFCTHT